MSFFVVESCKLQACVNWRQGNKCAKNELHIETYMQYLTNIHNSSICEIRKQIDAYRLNKMLEK